MNELQKYYDYEPSDFLLDEGFVEWVKWGDPENETFWRAVLAAHPHLKEKVEKARKLLALLESDTPQQPEDIKNSIWSSVTKAAQGKVIRMRKRNAWIAAASLLILTLGTAVIWKMKQADEKLWVKQENSQLLPGNDVAPGGNKAKLVLEDGSVVFLDSTGKGSIASQGAINVIKINDSQLVYRDAGEGNGVVHTNTITTPRGGQYQLTLSDGTSVWLNAASSLTFPTKFTGNERNVEITGEAYFEVAHDSSRPFYVKINSEHAYSGTEIKVLGTKFNVNAYPDEDMMKASLLNGSIRISIHGDGKILKPGQQAAIDNNNDKIAIDNDPDMDQVMAWKNGYFQFENFTIQQIMRQLARWYNVEVVYRGDIPDGHFVGKPSRNLNLSQILKVIEYSGVHLEIEGDKILVGK